MKPVFLVITSTCTFLSKLTISNMRAGKLFVQTVNFPVHHFNMYSVYGLVSCPLYRKQYTALQEINTHLKWKLPPKVLDVITQHSLDLSVLTCSTCNQECLYASPQTEPANKVSYLSGACRQFVFLQDNNCVSCRDCVFRCEHCFQWTPGVFSCDNCMIRLCDN